MLNQLRPDLEVVGGPSAEMRIKDFLPMPTQGVTDPHPQLMARWGNFLKGIGLEPPQGRTVPHGFTLKDIIGRQCRVLVGYSKDRDGDVRMNDGQPQTQIKLFGYLEPGEEAPPEAGQDKKPDAKPAATPMPTIPPAPRAPIDL